MATRIRSSQTSGTSDSSAVQMLAIELNDTALETALDALAKSLEDDERYQPQQFARLLAMSRRAE